jgi:hypothetical protein
MLVQVARPAIWFFTRLYRIANRIFDLDKRGAARNLRRLTKEVESECDCLFRKYGARVVPELSSGMSSFDWATVVVEVRSLQLRALRDRGPLTWQITAPTSRYSWQPLEIVCQRFTSENGRPSSITVLANHLTKSSNYSRAILGSLLFVRR